MSGPLYSNLAAHFWSSTSTTDPSVARFHHSLPGYAPTRTFPLHSIAKELGVGHVLLKDESNRLGLPAFKILGASWATFRALSEKLALPVDTPLEDLGVAARRESVRLLAATDGNHGRAVARMAALLGIDCFIFVPRNVDEAAQSAIASEGAKVVVVDGDYDHAVLKAKSEADLVPGGLLIQDTAFVGYEIIPKWIVEGYSTMLCELDEQALQTVGKPVDIVIVPVGVGSFAEAVVTHFKAAGRASTIVTVEPENAACLQKSLFNGESTSISTGQTIMTGMNCGTVSASSWPMLRQGVDVALTVTDQEAHCAVQDLLRLGVHAGPCGAATLAALRKFLHAYQDVPSTQLNHDSVVALLCTEGSRPYRHS